jgi:rod shape-determining protein MreD
MKRGLVDLLTFGAALAMTLALGQLDPRLPALVDPMTLYLLSVSLRGELTIALLAGVVTGWVSDSLQSGPYGIFGCANTTVAFAAARFARLFVLERRSFQLALFATAVAAQGFLVSLLLTIFRNTGASVHPIQLSLRVALLAPLAVLWVLAEERVEGWLKKRRTSSSSSA